MPTAVELSQLMGVGGLGWPISLGVSQKIVACLQFRKRALSSASAAEATTKCKIAQSVKNVPLSLIGLVASGFQPIKNDRMPSCVCWLWIGKTHWSEH
jgi:hypothetical protein